MTVWDPRSTRPISRRQPGAGACAEIELSPRADALLCTSPAVGALVDLRSGQWRALPAGGRLSFGPGAATVLWVGGRAEGMPGPALHVIGARDGSTLAALHLLRGTGWFLTDRQGQVDGSEDARAQFGSRVTFDQEEYRGGWELLWDERQWRGLLAQSLAGRLAPAVAPVW